MIRFCKVVRALPQSNRNE